VPRTPGLRRAFRFPRRSARTLDVDVDEELRFHLDLRAAELMTQRGLDADAARAEALRQFGDVEDARRYIRALDARTETATRRRELVDSLQQDLRLALRGLRRAPGFALVAALTLALGIGATTAIFSAVHAVVLRPLPFREPERLVRVYATSPATTPSDEVSPKTFAVWRRQNRSFARIAPIETRGVAFVDGARAPEQVTGVRTTADYFPLLGVRPLRGRTFTAEEDAPGRDRVVVLSHALWMRRFGGDPGVVGRSVRLDAVPVTVVGVMQPAFDVSPGGVDLWAPIAFTAEQETTVETGYLDVVARLRPGVTAERAQEELTALVRAQAERPADRTRGARLVPYLDDLVGAYRPRLYVLLGAVGLVLLIACVNVANLLLARGVGRAREMAVRAALGAGRGRVVRQLLVESTVLGLAGGAAGVTLAAWMLGALKAMSPDGVPRLADARLDARVLAFALAVTLASSLLFGLLPARRAARPELQSALRDGARAVAGATRDRVRQSLVALEVALSLVLLVGAGLLIRSAAATQRVDPGLDPANVWSGWVALPSAAYPDHGRVLRTHERILDSVRGLRDVESAAAVSVAPFAGLRALGLFVPEGRPLDRDGALLANLRLASPELFATLRIPVRQGRDFSVRDDSAAPPVVVVNEAFARRAWPGESAVGKRLYGGASTPGRAPVPREVVGVVGATHEDGLREERRPAVYLPIRQVGAGSWQAVQNSLFLVARTRGQPLAVTRQVEQAARAADPTLPVNGVRSLEQRMAESLATARFNTRLLAALGAAGLVLALVGIYGVIAYFVGQRTREIGVRMALGARPGQVVALVVRQGMRPVLAGIALGAIAAAAVTRVLASQLYGVGATDPLTFVAVTAVVAVAAALAAAIPARRAARVDPRDALAA
jgi:predicted permease